MLLTLVLSNPALLQRLEALAEQAQQSGVPWWLAIITLILGGGAGTKAILDAVLNKGKTKAEGTKVILEGLTGTLTSYNDSLLKANERVRTANERADEVERRLDRVKAELERAEAKADAAEERARHAERQMAELERKVGALEQRVQYCMENHTDLHGPK
jgi:chromosome segregation ATPase